MPEMDFRWRERDAGVRRKTPGSLERFQRAERSLSGGVSSRIRRGGRPYPLYFTHGARSRVWDVDGNSYIDYGLAWGPLILGHAPEAVAERLAAQARRELVFGAQCDLEIEVSEKLTSIIPCADLVSFASSGTEIVLLALRLARAVTGRLKYLKFEGHYHGWADQTLVNYHPTQAEIDAAGGRPIGVASGQLPHEYLAPAVWNDRESVERAFAGQAHEISAVICEPLLCNSGCIPAEPGFLEFLRDITTRHGALLIFDEVITGFRIDLRGAQGRYGVTPDLATYAKAVGAGTPLSVLAGRREYMDWIADGRVLSAGSMNGNPMCLAAAAVALDILSADGGAVYGPLRQRSDRLRRGIETRLQSTGLPVVTLGDGPVFQVLLQPRPPRNYRETLAADREAYSRFTLALLDEGIIVPHDGRWYVSVAHTDEDIDETLAAVGRAVAG